jgi:hypothetical protein
MIVILQVILQLFVAMFSIRGINNEWPEWIFNW